MALTIALVERLARVITVPLSGQPNAGQPRDVGDRKLYVASPEYVGEYALRFDWSDGHKTGIYPFDFLRDIALAT